MRSSSPVPRTKRWSRSVALRREGSRTLTTSKITAPVSTCDTPRSYSGYSKGSIPQTASGEPALVCPLSSAWCRDTVGECWAEGKVNQGATFHFTLPAAEEKQELETISRAANAKDKPYPAGE